MRRRNSYDSIGNLLPLRRRNPFFYWTAIIVVVAMLATGFAALVSVL